jgi:hypothetical protein
MKTQGNNTRRSLLREAKKLMDDTFVGGNELATKIRTLVKEAYVSLANLDKQGAAAKLVKAYEILKSAPLHEENVTHFRLALYALDLGLFLFEFARSDSELREIGWDIWDNRMYFQCGMYEALLSARLYLSFVRDGVMHEVAIEEVTSQNQNPKLKEILEQHAKKAQGGRDTGGDSQDTQ